MKFCYIEKKKIIVALVLACCIVMVLMPADVANGCRKGINVWLNAVVPSLMPFFIASSFLRQMGVCKSLPVGIFPIAMGALSGYPMGAGIAGDYYREGYIGLEKLHHILSYSMVTGPTFIIGTVGVAFLNSYESGLIIAVSHYLAALINGCIYREKSKPRETGNLRKEQKASGRSAGTHSKVQKGYYNMFTDAILESFRSLAIILAYIAVFMTAADLIMKPASEILLRSRESVAFLKGFMEMTVGCGEIGCLNSSELIKLVMASFTVSFGGLSVLCQSASMLKNCPVSLSELFKIKLTHGLISAAISFCIYYFVHFVVKLQ